MLEDRNPKERKSPDQFETRENIDNRNNKLTRNDGNAQGSPMVGLSKINTTTRIPRKIDSRTSASPLVSSSHHQPLSVPSSSSSSPCKIATTSTTELTPEIYFLIRQHAKTLEAINKITNNVDKLEHKIDDIYRKVKQINKYNESRGVGIKKGESSSSSGTTPNAPSEDSGVEYNSWTTNETGQDDDELLSLLNQITKFSDSIKKRQSQPLPPGSQSSPTRLNNCPNSSSALQSFSALLFESNVENFLANLDFVPELPIRPSNNCYYPSSMPTSQSVPPNQLNQQLNTSINLITFKLIHQFKSNTNSQNPNIHKN